VVYDFICDFSNVITKGNMHELFKGGGIVEFRNEHNKNGV
jgi:hypothetical protein